MYFYSGPGTHIMTFLHKVQSSITATIQINTFRWNIELGFGVTSIMFQFC